MPLPSVTIKDVAQKAGVSPATVSRVVSNRGSVSEKTRRKVLTAVRELGYRPNVIARSMVTKSTQMVGLVLTDIMNPFFAELARGVESTLWEEGYTLILANTDEDIQREQAVVSALVEKQVDGLILVPASSRQASHLLEIVHQQVPLVLVDRGVDDLLVDTVLVDNENGAYYAVSHLIRLGHRDIGMILDNLDITTNIERLAGYHRAMREQGLTAQEQWVRSCQYTLQSAYDIAYDMFQAPHHPTALFTASNFMTLGAIKAILDLGLKVPEDIALVGFDDLEWNQLFYPRLTAVAQPVFDLGRVAAQRLLARLRGDTGPPQEIRLRTTFIIRHSCGAQIHPKVSERINHGY